MCSFLFESLALLKQNIGFKHISTHQYEVATQQWYGSISKTDKYLKSVASVSWTEQLILTCCEEMKTKSR